MISYFSEEYLLKLYQTHINGLNLAGFIYIKLIWDTMWSNDSKNLWVDNKKILHKNIIEIFGYLFISEFQFPKI